MTLLTHFKAQNTKFKGEDNPNPSETIPDQATSPQELLRRYATGQPLGFKNTEPVYDEEENGYDVPEFYKMSKMDRLHHLQKHSEYLNDKRTEYEKLLQDEQIKKAQAKQNQKKVEQQQQNDQQGQRSETQKE